MRKVSTLNFLVIVYSICYVNDLILLPSAKIYLREIRDQNV